MQNLETIITQAYEAFNGRNIDAALKLMSENVSWPKASEGGSVVGKDAIRAYWTRQWSEFDPCVKPLEIVDRGSLGADVKVHQVVKSLKGEVLSDSEVFHTFKITNGLIESMHLKPTGDGADPSQAFHSTD